MTEIKDILILLGLVVHYFMYRLRLVKHPPEPYQYGYDEGLHALSTIFGWWRNIDVVNPDKCPKTGPAVFAGNHILIDDPFVVGNAIHVVSGRRIRVRVMMRDDFFRKLSNLVRFFVDPDEVTKLIGAIQISRQGADPAQLKPFVDLLRQSQVFLIFPGRSRSRSGQFIEYRDWIRSPGATSFFLAGAQADRPEERVPTVPVTRTFNPVTRRSTLVFGDPLHLPPEADRCQQRELDYQLVVAMGDLIEISVPHVLSAYLYLHCLHFGNQPIQVEPLRADLAAIFASIKNRYLNPAAHNPDNAIKETLRFLKARKMLHVHNGIITPNPEAILSVPPLPKYRKANPVKFLANQILHFTDVIRIIERIVLKEISD